MAAIQIVKVNESIIKHFKEAKNLDPVTERMLWDSMEKLFKQKLTEALNCDVPTIEIVWVK